MVNSLSDARGEGPDLIICDPPCCWLPTYADIAGMPCIQPTRLSIQYRACWATNLIARSHPFKSTAVLALALSSPASKVFRSIGLWPKCCRKGCWRRDDRTGGLEPLDPAGCYLAAPSLRHQHGLRRPLNGRIPDFPGYGGRAHNRNSCCIPDRYLRRDQRRDFRYDLTV